MGITHASRPARFAGRFFFAAWAFACAFAVSAETTDSLLQRADELKTTNNDQFQGLLKQLDAQRDQLTSAQHDFVDYLHAWQTSYLGDYQRSLSAFEALLERTQDSTVRARTRVTMISTQVRAARYEDAYTNLSALLDMLPQIDDRIARRLSLTVAASLYNGAGQYELAQSFADQAIALDGSDR